MDQQEHMVIMTGGEGHTVHSLMLSISVEQEIQMVIVASEVYIYCTISWVLLQPTPSVETPHQTPYDGI